MADKLFVKTGTGLVPADNDAREWFAKVKAGSTVRARVAVMRNPKFHRKFFAMLHVAFDNADWPEIETPYGPARCSFEMFRQYVTVKAGYFHMDVTPDGNFRATPKSISFAAMDEAEFERLYSAVLDVILARFLDWSKGDMENAVNNFLMEFG